MTLLTTMKTIRNHPARLLAFALGLACVPPMTHAATWYWIGPSDNSPTNIAYWNSTPTSGTGQTMSAAGATFSAGDVYDTNKGNKMLITGNFPTGLLLLNGSTIAIRGTGTRTIGNLDVDAAAGGTLAFDGYNQSSSVVSKFIVTNLNLPGTLRFHNPGASGSQSGARNMTYQLANVTGDGLFRLTGALSGGQRSTILLSIADQELTNDFSVEGVNVTFQSDITTAGTLSLIGTGLSLNLNTHSLVFSSITDGTNFLASGTYDSVDDLVGTGFENYFSGLSESSTLTVSAIPEPSALAFAAGAAVFVTGLLRRRAHRQTTP